MINIRDMNKMTAIYQICIGLYVNTQLGFLFLFFIFEASIVLTYRRQQQQTKYKLFENKILLFFSSGT